MKRLSVGFVSLGCPKNLVDTERMMSLLTTAGVSLTGDQSKADIVVINTCGFLEPAKNESLSTIDEFVIAKKKGNLKGVVVTGCMTERYLGLMSEKFPQVDAFLQTKDFSKITEVVKGIESGAVESAQARSLLVGEVEQLAGHSELPDVEMRLATKRSYAYVKIAEGCNRTCSFCIIPKLRGKLHSRSIAGIVEEVRGLAAMGTREILLIAQDLTSYGRDREDGASLLELLKSLEEIPGIDWVRLHYNYPRFFTDELIAFLKNSKKFSGYLDIPFQHISDSVLKMMRRPESSQEIRRLVGQLKSELGDRLSLRTTLMVGFPSETEKDFEELLGFVRWAEFDHMGAFKFYPEEGTPSATLPNQIEDAMKEDRYHKLMSLQKRVQKKKLLTRVGKSFLVMIDGLAEKTRQGYLYRGRHSGQAPEIDSLTYVHSADPLEVGSIIPVAVEKNIGDYDLLGVPEALPRQSRLERRG